LDSSAVIMDVFSGGKGANDQIAIGFENGIIKLFNKSGKC